MTEPAWEIDDGEIGEILDLPAPDRLAHFLQLTADWEEVWGLKDPDGWVVRRAGGEPGELEAFPLWPHMAFAAACAVGAWEGAAPESISLDELLDSLLPLLDEGGLRAEVFPTPTDGGVFLSSEELLHRLEDELDLGD